MIFDADSHVMEVEDWLRRLRRPGCAGAAGLARAGEGRQGRGAVVRVATGAVGTAAQRASQRQTLSRAPRDGRRPVHSTPMCARECSTHSASTRSSCSRRSRWGSSPVPHDPDVRYGGTRALNRAMAEFCATDERLLAVGYLPLNEPGRAIEELDAALESRGRGRLVAV